MEQRREFPDWEQFYQEREVESMPWFHSGLDQDLDRALGGLDIRRGSALDLCTGPGTQAIALAERGFRVTAIDVSQTAVDKALSTSRERGLEIEFRQDDFLNTKLDKEFDFIFDRGCFHVLQPEQRQEYVRIIRGLIKLGGYLFLKTFSQRETREGPYRFTPEEIKNLFGTDFIILSIEESFFQGTLDPPPKALFSVLKRAG
jgi:2-polyprenyl-3-methyl-5-hydroxy-6-metoxy-1,4-benzoquinol methylase